MRSDRLLVPLLLTILWFTSGCTQPSETALVSSSRLTPYLPSPSSTTTIAVNTSTPAVILNPTATPIIHIIQPDELVSSIALRYGVTLAQIQAANPGLDLNFPGENTPLIIPAPQSTPGAPAQPTPAPLAIINPTCYSVADGAALCLALATNANSFPVSYITGEFIVQTDDEQIVRSFSALLDTLPAGASLPVYAYFPAPFPYPFSVSVVIHSAFGNTDHTDPGLTAIIDQVDISSDGIGARVTGKITSTTSLPSRIALVAAAYSADDPAGIRRIELTPTSGITEAPFTIWIYSAGPALDRVEVFTEPF